MRVRLGVVIPSCPVSRVGGFLEGSRVQSPAVMVSVLSALLIESLFSRHIFLSAKQQASLTGFGKKQKKNFKETSPPRAPSPIHFEMNFQSEKPEVFTEGSMCHVLSNGQCMEEYFADYLTLEQVFLNLWVATSWG